MEGLIPMVCKAIKKKTTRRQYECLSSGAAQSYNMKDFYIGQCDTVTDLSFKPSIEKNKAERKGHRRYRSVEDLSAGFSSVTTAAASPPQKQLVRFRSHRMFSCVMGT